MSFESNEVGASSLSCDSEVAKSARCCGSALVPVSSDQSNTSPLVALASLRVLWLQVGGTICNLRCHHCFISCSPENDKFGFMSLPMCQSYIEQAKAAGVEEFYLTGGEPFANSQIVEILEMALLVGPTTVLTNATLLRERNLERLEELRTAASHALEIRVSLDGHCAAMNDAIRGQGTFDQAMEGVVKLVAIGFAPIITITRTWEGCDDAELAQFKAMLALSGYAEPRLKILPLLKIGGETDRSGPYSKDAIVTQAMMDGYDQTQLLCSESRLATDQGVWVCPILLDAPEARMGATLSDSMDSYPLRHSACHTCWHFGAICSNEVSRCDS